MWLYLMFTTLDIKRTKIGITKNSESPFQRFISLRSADPYLQIFGAFKLPEWYYFLDVEEKYWHDYFKEKRIRFFMSSSYSEWFSEYPGVVFDNMMRGMAERACEKGGVKPEFNSGIASNNDLAFYPDSTLYSRDYGFQRTSPYTEDLPCNPIIISSKNINFAIDVNSVLNI